MSLWWEGKGMTPSDIAARVFAAQECSLNQCSCHAAADRAANGRASGKTHCVAHHDPHPSMSVDVRDGTVVWHCFAGCSQSDVAQELRRRDLLHPRAIETEGLREKSNGGGRGYSSSQEPSNTRTQSAGFTVGNYAALKGLPSAALREWGLSTIHYQGEQAVRIPYYGLDGQETSVRLRLAADGGNRFRWKAGSKPILYGLQRLRADAAKGFVILCEGESDTQTLWLHGYPAVGLPGATSWNEQRDAPLFEGIPTIYVIDEGDDGGEGIRRWLAKSAIRDRVKLVNLRPFGAKDPSELYLQDRDAFRQRFDAALLDAKPFTTEREAARALAEAAGLLDDPRLLDRVVETMRLNSYAGDTDPPLLLYLAMTSRFMERPINVAVVAPSASGKNRAVDEARRLLPADAVHVISAGSARALIYDSAADYRYRVILFAEADSIPDDGPAASAVRTLAEGNELRYSVTEQDKRSGRFETRHILKHGPTGLITTSTKSLAHQLGTRVLEISIPDDADQTREIIRMQARIAAGKTAEVANVDEFHAAQTWLELAGERRVVVPFGEALSDLVPSDLTRLRRDFQQLLTAIQTVAFLHQRQRQRDEQGRITATLEDYAVVQRLFAPIFGSIAAEGVTPTIRTTVEAIGVDEEISLTDLAARVGLRKSAMSSRVSRAIAGGWLVNRELRKGHLAKLARGAPLPEEREALPSALSLRRVFECSPPLGLRYTPPLPTDDDAIIAGEV